MDKNLHRTIQRYEIPGTQDELILEFTYAHFAGFEPAYVLQLMYLEFNGLEDGLRSYNACNTEYFPAALLDRAIAAFDIRAAGTPFQATNLGYSIDNFLWKAAKNA